MSAATTVSRCHVIAVALMGIVLILCLRQWRATSPENQKDRDARRGSALANESSVLTSGLVEPPRTKFHIRAHHSKPTIEETAALIRTTLIPLLDLPADQPLPERIAQINELIQKAGVEPYRLRLILRSGDAANQWRFKDKMRIREVPVHIALKYLVDSTKLRFHVRENGIIELTSWREEPQSVLPDPPQKSMRSPSDETDIFGNDPSASEEIDPFAVPPAR